MTRAEIKYEIGKDYKLNYSVGGKSKTHNICGTLVAITNDYIILQRFDDDTKEMVIPIEKLNKIEKL